jgi:hypothetical protein
MGMAVYVAPVSKSMLTVTDRPVALFVNSTAMTTIAVRGRKYALGTEDHRYFLENLTGVKDIELSLPFSDLTPEHLSVLAMSDELSLNRHTQRVFVLYCQEYPLVGVLMSQVFDMHRYLLFLVAILPPFGALVKRVRSSPAYLTQ